MQQILTVYRESFVDAPVSLPIASGCTVAELVERMPVANDFWNRGTVAIGGHVVPSSLWHVVRPKPETIVTMHMPAAGGGGDDSGKAIFAFVASLALTVAAGWIVNGGLATSTGWFAAGSISASVLAGTVSLVGSLLLSALVPPPVERRDVQSGSGRRDPGNASAEGNVLDPNGPVVRVVGQRKVFPPLACEPFTYFDGPDEVVEAVYVLAGPHQITDIKVGAASLADAGVEYELREGWPGDERLTLVEHQSFTEPSQDELRGHVLSESDNRTLEDAEGGIFQTLPQVYVVGTREKPDEHQLQLAFPQGLFKQNNTSPDPISRRIPIRLRIRRRGFATWINLPELHFQAANIGLIRCDIRLKWVSTVTVSPAAATSEGWVEARRFCPGQTNAPVSPDYSADPYFGTTGDVFMTATNIGTTGVVAVSMDRYSCTIELLDSVFPKDQWEIEIKRGASFTPSSYVSSTYAVSSVVWDFYSYQNSPPQIVENKTNASDSIYMMRSVSVWNEHPLPTSDFAAIAIRARNRKIDRLSCIAGGYVPDWDGVGWRNWTVTSNPAPHLRDIYVGRLNVDPIDPSEVDDAALVAWRTACVAAGYTCNALVQGSTIEEAATIVAACGYARPRMSERWGIVRDYDRSAESPVQIFTPLNMREYSWTKAFARTPNGFRVTFDDEEQDYKTDQVLVFGPGQSHDTSRIEQTRYEGLTKRVDVIRRAEYDQLQPELRSCFHNFTAGTDSIICERGDLIGLTHETIDETVGFARIADITFNGGGQITAIRVESQLPGFGEPGFDAITDMGAVIDMGMIGETAGVMIRRTDGTMLTAGGTVSGTTFTFTTPQAAAGVDIDCLVSYGRLGKETLRLIVFNIVPGEDFTAKITAVDEAPELWT